MPKEKENVNALGIDRFDALWFCELLRGKPAHWVQDSSRMNIAGIVMDRLGKK